MRARPDRRALLPTTGAAALTGRADRAEWLNPALPALDAFAAPVTNDRSFVHYPPAGVPSEADWSLAVGGEAAERAITPSLDDLRGLPSFAVMAVCQRPGNRRGPFSPHVPGVQWSVGAMGNATWRGVRLRDVPGGP